MFWYHFVFDIMFLYFFDKRNLIVFWYQKMFWYHFFKYLFFFKKLNCFLISSRSHWWTCDVENPREARFFKISKFAKISFKSYILSVSKIINKLSGSYWKNILKIRKSTEKPFWVYFFSMFLQFVGNFGNWQNGKFRNFEKSGFFII